VFVLWGTHPEEFSYRYPGPQPTEAWRSAIRRQRNVRAAITFWMFNVLLVVSDALDKVWAALHLT
jgi:hypothetical protein